MKKIFLLLGILLVILLTGCESENINTTTVHSDDELHDHSVEIEGKDMKFLTVKEVAYLWDIDSEVLLERIIQEFDLKEKYTIDSLLEDIRNEYKFSPAMIKDIAEDIKQQGINNE